MRKITSILIGLTPLLINPPPSWALDSAILEFSIAVPNPVTAGDVVNLQSVAINTGTEEWLKDTYYWEAELYDIDKQYISKTQRQTGTADIKQGGPTAANLSFFIPQNYGGFYFFRVYLTHNDRRVAESPYILFKVTERSMAPIKPPKVAFGGSAIASFQNSDLATPRNGQGNSVFNLTGKTETGSYLFNSVNNHKFDDIWQSYIILGSYATARGNVNVGDVSPNFTSLTLSGRSMRGLEMNISPTAKAFSNTRWSLVGGRTVAPKAGTASSNGTYERLVYALGGGLDFPEQKAKLNISVLTGLDNKSSLSVDPLSSEFRGPNLKPQSNNIAGTSLTLEPLKPLKISLDFALSQFKNDLDISTSVAGSAAQLSGSLSFDKVSVTASARRTSPNFTNFGAPSITADRLNYDLTSAYRAAPWTNINISFNQFSDNLGNDPSKTTSVQRVIALGPSFTLPKETSVTTNFSQNTAQGNPRSALNNISQSASLGLTKGYKGHSLSASLQNTAFKDKNQKAHDLGTNTFSLTLNLAMNSNLRFAFGNTGSQTHDKADGHDTTNISQSASANFAVIPNKISGQIWTTSTQAETTGSTPAKSRDWSLNSELTLQVMPNLSFSVGGSYAAKNDLISTTKTNTKSLSTRMSLNF